VNAVSDSEPHALQLSESGFSGFEDEQDFSAR